MIKKIEIKDIATFDHKGIEIDELKMVNVIYGSNGTGKSTISKVLAQVDNFPQCHIDWKDGIPLDVLVYNKEFCEKNYSEHMPGVFTLGDAANDSLNEISDKKLKLEEIKKLGIGYGNEITKQEDALKIEVSSFREAAWNDLLKNHESYFSKSSIGAGTKDNFLLKLTKAYETK